MDIHEYQAKQILKANGINVPAGKVAYTALEAKNVAREISPRGPWVLKAQIHSGARNNGHFVERKAGKGGGIRIAKTLKDVYDNAAQMLGSTLITSQNKPDGNLVSRIYVEAYTKVEHTFYLSMAIDRTYPAITILAANTETDDIAAIIANSQEKIIRVPLDLKGPTKAHSKRIAEFLHLHTKSFDSFHRFVHGLFKAFIKSEALMVEINPAGIRRKGDIFALDAKITIDNRAVYRHKDISSFRDEDDIPPRELKAARNGFSYHEYNNGNIGCIVNGSGLALAMVGMLKGAAACTLNIKGGVDRDKIAAGIKIIATNPKVEGIVINILGGFVRCDLIADGIIDTAAEVGMNMPLVVRFEGTNRDEACNILEQSNLPLIMAESMDDAIAKVLKAVEESE